METLIIASYVIKPYSRRAGSGEAAYYETYDGPRLTAGNVARFATAIATFGIFVATLGVTA